MIRTTFLYLLLALPLLAPAQLRVLIVDGQNNHQVWPKSTVMMKQYLERSGLFTVDVARSRYTWRADREPQWLPLVDTQPTEDLAEPRTDPGFAPDFSRYDVVVSNFGWRAAPWPEATQLAFEEFVDGGGGFVSVHAADNSFPAWAAYNSMIGIGGWGDRSERDGPYVYYDDSGKLVRDDSEGGAGAHGPQSEFPITVRVADHPITAGLPATWLTSTDECYAKLRGPAEQMTVLATGRDLTDKAPTDRNEPVLMAIDYGEGRIFHTTLGHDTEAFEGVGFITTFLRGTEWAATGEVTQAVPDDFPSPEAATARPFELAPADPYAVLVPVQTQLDAYNTGDLELFLSAYADDVKIYNYPDELTMEGKATMRERYGNMFASQPDLQCRLVSRTVMGDRVVDHESVVHLRGEAPNEVVAIYRVEGGLITEVRFMR